jgi:glycine/D-amino acid oxidase-like deaminating enzyme
MPRWDVQVHGAGWAGLAVARGLTEAGVRVRLVDPAGAFGGASGRATGLALPTHPEHPHRLEAGIGTDAARALVAFVRAGLRDLPGLVRTGVDWVATGAEAAEVDDALAAARRIGLAATRTTAGYHLHDGGVVDLAALAAALVGADPLPVYATAEDAEIDVLATGAVVTDGWLADKITPVRWQVVSFEAPPPAASPEGPRPDRQATAQAEGPTPDRPPAAPAEGHTPYRQATASPTPDRPTTASTPTLTQQGTVRWLRNPTTGLLDASGARWATPHMEVGETVPEPEPRVTAMLERLTRHAFPGVGAVRGVRAGIVGESCDGLPIVGPVPGRPRIVVCTGFGVAGLTYALPCARAVVDGLLDRPGAGVPAVFRVTRFG